MIKHKDRFAGASRCHRAEPLGAIRQDGRELKFCPGAAHARRAARARGQGRGDARHARADARRDRRRPIQSSGVDVGAQARRLPRARIHRRDRRQAALAARARAARTSFRGSSRSLAKQAAGEHDPRRRARGVRRERQAVVRRDAGSRAAEDGTGDRGCRPERCPWSSAASICCTSPASTCASRPTSDRRRYLAQCLLPSPLVQLVHAAEDGIALQRRGRSPAASRA